MKKMIRRITNKCVKLMFGLSNKDQRINIYKTLLFNFLAFGIKGVWKCPVYIYRNTKIYSVGKISIECVWKRGLVRIGQLDFKSQGVTKFFNSGEIAIYGDVNISGCTIIENCGSIVFNGYNWIGDGSYIFIRDTFIVGEYTRIGFHSFVMDCDDHFTVDVETGKVSRNKKAIKLGKYNWIANSTVIKKGVITPDYLIVASANALLAKDYSDLPPYSVVGGSPAKLLKSGIRRIYNKTEEKKINQFFIDTPNTNVYIYDDISKINEICL